MSGTDQPFPRGTAFPKQSPLYWVGDKDRYLRQLLLRDLQERFGRKQLVYFTRCDSNAQIDIDDDRLLLELLSDCGDEPLDLHVETNGGYTDATEKLIALLEPFRARLRVIVPRRAKSNGTLLALAASEIVLGVASELGPIDPSIQLGPGQAVPAQFVLQAPDADPIIKQIAQHAVNQTTSLATRLLNSGQLSAKPERVAETVVSLSTRNIYPSHGSVIDAHEAGRLGLNVTFWEASNDD